MGEAERTIIAAASIVGQAFWPEAVAAVTGQDASAVQDGLSSLSVRELVRRLPTSSMRLEREYAFWHVLARDVAYTVQPRVQRLDGHLAVAEWIDTHGGRSEDVAGIVAHHLATALEIADVSKDPRAEAIRPAAREALAEAARNAMGLDVEAATGLYARALELAPPGTPERGALLRGYGVAAGQSARPREAVEALEEALALAELEGDPVHIAGTMLELLLPLQAIQDHRWVTMPAEAAQLLEPLGPSATLVDVLIAQARSSLWDWSWDDTRRYADRAIAMAAELGLPTPPRALGSRGSARAVNGDRGGLEDLDRAVEMASAAGDWDQAAALLINYAALAGIMDGHARARELSLRAIRICDAHGLRSLGYVHRSSLAGTLVDAGDLDDAIELIDAILEPVEASGDVISTAWLLTNRNQVALTRGDVDTATTLLPRLVAIVDAHPDQDDLNPARIVAATVQRELGEPSEAKRLLRAVLATPVVGPNLDFWVGPATRLAIALEDLELADDILAALTTSNDLANLGRRWSTAMLVEARGDAGRAAPEYLAVARDIAGYDIPFETASAYLAAARCLIATGRVEAAQEPIALARELFMRLGAAPSLAVLDALDRE